MAVRLRARSAGRPSDGRLVHRLSINFVLLFVSIQIATHTEDAQIPIPNRSEKEREGEEELDRRQWTLMQLSSGMRAVRKIQERAALMRNIRFGMPAAIAMSLFGDPASVGVCPTMTLAGHRSPRDGRPHRSRVVKPPCTSRDTHYRDAIRITGRQGPGQNTQGAGVGHSQVLRRLDDSASGES
uniref:Uncharacterized protein n=1 Tax=Oryza rufipogon TaxID=4529 RepID=A0A0E0NVN6_ORYRU